MSELVGDRVAGARQTRSPRTPWLVHTRRYQALGYLDYLDLILEEELAVRDERRFHRLPCQLPHYKTIDTMTSFSRAGSTRGACLAALAFVDQRQRGPARSGGG
jgi:hypothetical protein